MTAIPLARVERALRKTGAEQRLHAEHREEVRLVSTALTRSGSWPVSVSVSCGYHHAAASSNTCDRPR